MTRHPISPTLLTALLIGLSACATVSEPDDGDGRASASMSQAIFTDLHFDCRDAPVLLIDVEASPVLVAYGESIPMRHTRAASGVRFEAVSDTSTVLHMKGESAWVSLRGHDHTGCKLAVPPATPFNAQGQEPPWRVQVLDDHLTLTLGYAGDAHTLPLSHVEHAGLATRIQARGPSGPIALDIVRGVCRDSMSGMPHPYSVTLTGVDDVQPGCGGQPAELLAGKGWLVHSLDGVAPLAGSRVTLRFLEEDGRVAGTGSCNRYNAGYGLDGESLRFSQAAMTKMACAEELMRQEQHFHAILGGIDRFDMDEAGNLILIGSQGRLSASPLTPAD